MTPTRWLPVVVCCAAALLACSFDTPGFGTEALVASSTSETDAGGEPTDGSPACGDGRVDPDELCDDGNQANDDDCTSACAPPRCGDGFVQPHEECDGPTPGVKICNAECLALRADEFLLDIEGPIPEYQDPSDPHAPLPEGSISPTYSACRSLSAPNDLQYPYIHLVELSVRVQHPASGELVVFLHSPAGTWLIVSNRPGFDEPEGGSPLAGGHAGSLSSEAVVTFMDGAMWSGESLGEGLSNDQQVCIDDGRCDFFPERGASLASLTSFSDLAGTPALGKWTVCVQDHVPNGSQGVLHAARVKMFRRTHP